MQTLTNESTGVVRNGLSVSKLHETVSAIRKVPTLGFLKFHVHNQWSTIRLQSQAKVDTFYGAGQEQHHERPLVVNADEPAVLLGDDTGPNPAEIALSALSACMTSALVYKATAMGSDLESIESEFEGDLNLTGSLGIDPRVKNRFQEVRVKFKVKSDLDAATIEEMVKSSPVYDTFVRPVKVVVEIEKV